jgi:hypothetical protein
MVLPAVPVHFVRPGPRGGGIMNFSYNFEINIIINACPDLVMK